MADILTEQITALKEQQSAFKQASTGNKSENEKSTQQKLPKGVVLDKDGKPFVTIPRLPAKSQMLTITLHIAAERAHPPLNGVRWQE